MGNNFVPLSIFISALAKLGLHFLMVAKIAMEIQV